MTPDAHAAAMGLAAGYLFWRWLREPCWDYALLAGLVLGLAELNKFTLLIFYPLWLVMWLLYRLPEYRQMHSRQWFRELLQFSVLAALSVFIINIGYGFEGSFQRLGDYRFQTLTMTGAKSLVDVPGEGGNRFANTWLGRLPMPIPKNYLQGIDLQKLDFERGLPSYLRGEWSDHGWWYYYLYALAIKEPLGTWSLVALALTVTIFGRGYSASWRDEIVLLLPAATILTLVSSQTGFGVHSRYVLPMLPFVFVWIGKVARVYEMRPFTNKRLAMATIVSLALVWSVVSSLWYYPHSLSYFNELAGGPKYGHYHLLNSNIAWGQDVFYLKDWLDKHPEAKPFHFASYSWACPHLAGIKFTLPPVGPVSSEVEKPKCGAKELGPLPGWHAIDVNHLHGTDDIVVDENGDVQHPIKEGFDYSYFLHFQPVAMAGYSIYIYHITVDEANRVRRELGLPVLKGGRPTDHAGS